MVLFENRRKPMISLTVSNVSLNTYVHMYVLTYIEFGQIKCFIAAYKTYVHIVLFLT